MHALGEGAGTPEQLQRIIILWNHHHKHYELARWLKTRHIDC